jgi:hypothetical protein
VLNGGSRRRVKASWDTLRDTVYTGWASRTLGARRDRRRSVEAAISGHRIDGDDKLDASWSAQFARVLSRARLRRRSAYAQVRL